MLYILARVWMKRIARAEVSVAERAVIRHISVKVEVASAYLSKSSYFVPEVFTSCLQGIIFQQEPATS